MCTAKEICGSETMNFRWHGPEGKFSMRNRRMEKRDEAEARNAKTKPENRRKARLLREHKARKKAARRAK